MNCDNCNEGIMVSATFAYQRIAPDGSVFEREVEGFQCPACGEQMILGRAAEQLSRDWFQVFRTATPPSPTILDGSTTVAVAGFQPRTQTSGYLSLAEASTPVAAA